MGELLNVFDRDFFVIVIAQYRFEDNSNRYGQARNFCDASGLESGQAVILCRCAVASNECFKGVVEIVWHGEPHGNMVKFQRAM